MAGRPIVCMECEPEFFPRISRNFVMPAFCITVFHPHKWTHSTNSRNKASKVERFFVQTVKVMESCNDSIRISLIFLELSQNLRSLLKVLRIFPKKSDLS